jgi:hypothetical protein
MPCTKSKKSYKFRTTATWCATRDHLLSPAEAGGRGSGAVPAGEIWDAEKQESLVFLSNLLAFGATTIADIYKDRWQVELFFKALKHTLKIKTFVGTSANAVRTQVWTALIAMLVLKYLQLKSTFSWSLSTLAALLRQQLFFYRDLYVWLNDPFRAPPALAGVHDDAQQLAITW